MSETKWSELHGNEPRAKPEMSETKWSELHDDEPRAKPEMRRIARRRAKGTAKHKFFYWLSGSDKIFIIAVIELENIISYL